VAQAKEIGLGMVMLFLVVSDDGVAGVTSYF
jgi:hypothetical protein